MNKLKIIAMLACVIAGMFAPLQSFAADGYTVAPGQSRQIDEHSICKVVTNNNSDPIFVPTKDATEWSSFLGNPPYVTVAACPTGCAGYSRDGYCFYVGSIAQTCNQVCSTHSGINSAGMNRLIDRTRSAGVDVPGLSGGQLYFAGGGGPATYYYCHKIAMVLAGVPSTASPVLESTSRAYGCAHAGGKSNTVSIDSRWSGSGVYNTGSGRPICACNR